MTDTVVIKNHPNWFVVLLCVAVIIASILLIRGCQQAKHSDEKYQVAANQITRLKKDSIEQDKKLDTLKRDTAQTNALVDDLLASSEILEDSLNRSEVHTAYLARRIKELSGKTDTIELLNNCEDVADAYLKEIDLNKAVRASKDSIQWAMKLQIVQRDAVAKHWENRYIDCMKGVDTISHALPSLKPRPILFIGGGGIYNPFVQGGGPAVAFLGKKKTLWTGKLSFTNHGNVYDLTLLKPINFKKH